MQCLFCCSVFTAFNCRFLQSSIQVCHILFLEYVNSEMQTFFASFWYVLGKNALCFKLFLIVSVG